MINKDSIVTAYDEHLTLVEWLQKVETALDNAVLTNLGIAKLSDQGNVATYQVTATFADNTTIVSDTFTLPSTNIVTAFSNLTALVNEFDDRITDNTNDVASIINIIDIGNDKIKASTLQNSINGSDGVIVDVDATNDKLEIHLSAELQAKLARVLLTPSSAPTTRKVVTIDTNGAQDNVDGTELTTLMSNIVDSQGRKRFVEGTFTNLSSIEVTEKYNKWSLCGSHLMCVIAVLIPAGTFKLSQLLFKMANYPSWLNNKLIAITATDPSNWGYVSFVKGTIVNTAWGAIPTETTPFVWDKGNVEGHGFAMYIKGMSSEDITITEAKIIRVQFDFVIDTD